MATNDTIKLTCDIMKALSKVKRFDGDVIKMAAEVQKALLPFGLSQEQQLEITKAYFSK